MTRPTVAALIVAVFACAVIAVAVLWAHAERQRPLCVATGSQQVSRDSHGGSTLVWRSALEERCP